MLSATSFAEPKLSELVPMLTGESKFASWSTALNPLPRTLPFQSRFVSLASHPNFTSDPVFYDANAIYQPGNASSKLGKGNASAKPKHFYTFYQRKTAHTSEEYFQNPANANANANNNNTNATKSANVVNAPALTSNSNPIVHYNLFNN
ncbi:hypothetical protein PENPOL_c001G01739 [Penicillium polonicum]|uniref:Uncharacterized protein n=1 Tax=Penicillium polonicum TaxID=60169 RepID=A0A1V6P219_PENPO|nr:hypothetical protein PENPOL_c001G01739 [Penicillium polonicum]